MRYLPSSFLCRGLLLLLRLRQTLLLLSVLTRRHISLNQTVIIDLVLKPHGQLLSNFVSGAVL